MKSVLFGSDNSTPNETAVSYNCINATVFSSWSTNQALRNAVVPGPIMLSNFYLKTDIAPGAGNAYIFTVMKNNNPTTLEITIADANTVGTDTTHSASFAAGDVISLRSTPVGAPATLSVETWNSLVQTDTQTAPVLSVSGSASNSATSYGVMSGGQAQPSGWSTTETDMQIIVPTSGTLSHLYNIVSSTPGSGKSWQYSLMVNGVATSLQTTIANTTTTANNTAVNVSVAAGDTISMRCIPSGTPTNSSMSFSVLFTPTIEGESFFGFGSSVAPLASTSYEQPLGLGTNAWSGNEANRPMTFGPYSITKMYVKLVTAPGVGATRTFTLRKAGVSTALAAAISDVATTANITSNVTFLQGDQITLQSSVTGSPAAATGGVHAGFLVYIAPDTAQFAPRIMIY